MSYSVEIARECSRSPAGMALAPAVDISRPDGRKRCSGGVIPTHGIGSPERRHVHEAADHYHQAAPLADRRSEGSSTRPGRSWRPIERWTLGAVERTD